MGRFPPPDDFLLEERKRGRQGITECRCCVTLRSPQIASLSSPPHYRLLRRWPPGTCQCLVGDIPNFKTDGKTLLSVVNSQRRVPPAGTVTLGRPQNGNGANFADKLARAEERIALQHNLLYSVRQALANCVSRGTAPPDPRVFGPLPKSLEDLPSYLAELKVRAEARGSLISLAQFRIDLALAKQEGIRRGLERQNVRLLQENNALRLKDACDQMRKLKEESYMSLLEEKDS